MQVYALERKTFHSVFTHAYSLSFRQRKHKTYNDHRQKSYFHILRKIINLYMAIQTLFHVYVCILN